MKKLVCIESVGLLAMAVAMPDAAWGQGAQDAARETEREESARGSSTQVRELDEIVVTAERRAERAQDLPMAISAYSGETLSNRGVDSIEGLQQLAPSLQVGNLARGFGTTITMRGLSGSGAEPGVGISQDGVPYATRHLAAVNMLDVERVEVLRGPQGTLQGRNTTGGAVHFHSKRPTDALEGGVKATLGNYDRLALESVLSGPIVQDRLLGRVAVRSDRADGWVTNTLRAEKLGHIDLLQARASLLGRLTDDFETLLILEKLRDQSSTVSVDSQTRLRPDMPTLPEFAGVPAFDPNARTIQQDLPRGVDRDQNQAILRLTWDMGPSAQLTAITGYVDVDVITSQDHNDATAAPVLVWGPPDGTPLVHEQEQVSQEATLTMDLSDRLDMIVGGLYLENNARESVTFGLPYFGLPNGTVDSLTKLDLTSFAGYTQWRYRLTDAVRLTAGIRYTKDEKESFSDNRLDAAPPVIREASWDAWTPRFSVDYSPTDNVTVYAGVARGFSSGGFTFGDNTFNPEIVKNYEVGVKGNFMENRLRAALTGFYMDYTDLQITIIGTADDPTAGGQSLGREITNANATISGVEMELDALVTDRLQFSFGGTWLDATYEDFFAHDELFPELGDPGPVGLNVRDLSDNRLMGAPRRQFNVSGEYRIPLRTTALGGNLQGVLRASYFWRDKVYFNFFNHEAISQDDYGIINLSAGIESQDGTWQLTAFVDNLGDDLYRTNASGPISLIPEIQFASFRLGPPRTYGLTLSYNFF